MKYIITFLIALLYLPVSGQATDAPDRKTEIEICMGNVYTVTAFCRVADLLGMTTSELSDYPVICPVKIPVISSGFGMRVHPIYKVWKFHRGIDFVASKGTPVYATGNGVVTRKGYHSGYGNFIEVRHAGGFRSFYAHLSKAMVNVGDSVSIIQPIARVGSTGIATGSHLHYEIRKGKRFLNPIQWCLLLPEFL